MAVETESYFHPDLTRYFVLTALCELLTRFKTRKPRIISSTIFRHLWTYFRRRSVSLVFCRNSSMHLNTAVPAQLFSHRCLRYAVSVMNDALCHEAVALNA